MLLKLVANVCLLRHIFIIIIGIATLCWSTTATENGGSFKPGNEFSGLCVTSPKQRRKDVIARYQSSRVAPGGGGNFETFVKEWERDLYPEEAERYQPLRLVRGLHMWISCGYRLEFVN